MIPLNNSGVIPAPNEHTTALTNVLFTQFLSENFAVSFGKLDTLDGDANAFAHGRGKTQFMNSAFVFNPTAVRPVPYSTLGVAFTVLRNMQPILSFSIIDSEDSATTNGIDDLFSNGATFSAEARLPVEFFERPGHQLIGGTWSSRNVALLSQNPRLLLPFFGLPLQRASDSWSLYYNFDQYLVVDPCDPSRGWGNGASRRNTCRCMGPFLSGGITSANVEQPCSVP